MGDRSRTMSGDLTFDTAGRLLRIVYMLAALGFVEVIDRTFNPFDTVIFDRLFGQSDGYFYLTAFVVAYTAFSQAAERLLGDRFDRLQSTVARSLPSGRRTNDGYRWLGETLALPKWAKDTLAHAIYFYLAILAVVISVIYFFPDGLRAGGNSFYFILTAFIGVFLAFCSVLAAASVVAGRALDRRHSRSSSP